MQSAAAASCYRHLSLHPSFLQTREDARLLMGDIRRYIRAGSVQAFVLCKFEPGSTIRVSELTPGVRSTPQKAICSILGWEQL